MLDMLITTIMHIGSTAHLLILHLPGDAHCNARQMFVQNVSSV